MPRASQHVSVPPNLYGRDFFSWCLQQADLLRRQKIDKIDIANIAEELETLGRAEINALRSSYRLLCMHLLKWMLQPAHQGASWRHTITEQRNQIDRLLQDNPGLKPRRADLFREGYEDGRREAAAETNISTDRFPAISPFSLEEAESHDFWPTDSP
jgi:hypothetical protein